MKRFLSRLTLLALLLFALPSWANYAYVSYTANTANLATVTIAPTAGNLEVMFISTSAGGGSPTVTQVQDSGGNNWTQALATVYDPTKNAYHSIFYKANVAAAITSVTATFNGGTPGSCLIAIAQYSGIDTTSPFIIEAHQSQNAPGTTANAISSGAATVSSQPALVIGMVQNDGNGDTVAGTGYTQRVTNGDWTLMDKRVTATGSNTATATAATHGGGDVYWTTVIAFKEPVVAGVDGSMFQLF